MIETEVKLRWATTVSEAEDWVRRQGYALAEARALEVDQLFDRASGELLASDQTLRLRRRGARAIVTYKGPAERQRYKSREEIEFDISSAEAFLVVLDRLGYRPGFRCEKYSSKFADMPGADRNEAGVITIDETPVGVFLELEGQKDWIDSTAARLGFTADDYLTMSYAALYQRFRESHPQSPIDMLFL